MNFKENPKVVRVPNLHHHDLLCLHFDEEGLTNLKYLLVYDSNVDEVPAENNLLVAMTLERLLHIELNEVWRGQVFQTITKALYRSQRATLLQAAYDERPLSSKAFGYMCAETDVIITSIGVNSRFTQVSIPDRLEAWKVEIAKVVERLCNKSQ